MISILASFVFAIGTYGSQIYEVSYSRGVFSVLDSIPASNASYLARDASGALYGCSENDPDSGVYLFPGFGSEDPAGQTVFGPSGSNGPCHILLPEDSPWAMTADYGAGSVTVFCKDSLASGPVQTIKFAEGSHVHQLTMVPSSELMVATDLGLNCIHVFRLDRSEDASSPLTELPDLEVPCSGGPRHVAFNDDASVMYCLTEKSGEIVAYKVWRDAAVTGEPCLVAEDVKSDPTPAVTVGLLTEFQRVKADEVDAHGSADIRISGKYLFASHRLENDGISVYRIGKDGKLKKKSYCHTGVHPRCFVVEGRLVFVACRDSHTIEVYRFNRLTGKLKKLPAELKLDSRPVCIIN